MKKILVPVLCALVLVVVVVIGIAATKPDTFEVHRSMSINAPASKIYNYISDFHQWASWSPYEKRDPAMTKSYSGAASGKGAAYAWKGNSEVGEGNMQISEATMPSNVDVQLHFLKPFESNSMANFTLQPDGNATKVTWSMRGPNMFIGKVMSIFMNMDEMIGKDFETGLSNLKTVTEHT